MTKIIRLRYLKFPVFIDESILDSFDLSGYHREHRNIDSIELIKAAPSSTLTQSREDLTNGLQAQRNKC